jgi:hypothetical protein
MRAVAIILLTAMIFSLSAFRLVYKLIISHAKADAAMVLKSHPDKLRLLPLSDKDYLELNWKEKGKEFLYQGQLYDVISLDRTVKGYLVKAYSDKEETRWVVALHNYMLQIFSRGDKSNHTESFFYSLQKEYPPICAMKLDPVTAPEQLYFACCRASLPSPFIKPVWHPPACA